VSGAYQAHARGQTSVPHSLFLHFPDDAASRIIALPAYVHAGRGLAGVKWVSSFPRNIEHGLERASAVVVLNSAETGHPEAVIEGSTISARRTAASAALAASVLHQDPEEPAAGLIGCGLIGYEITRFLVATRPALRRLTVFDLSPERAGQFREQCLLSWPHLAVDVAGGIEDVLARHTLVAFATTAGRPHVRDLSRCPAGAVILHISLRDIAPEALLECDNVTDDVDHVCRAETSAHLAERLTGGRDFLRCTLGEILTGAAPARAGGSRTAVFSPFGLGILDIALTALVHERAVAEGRGVRLDGFLPPPWTGPPRPH
jgi:ornithine cyclodeaminase